MFYQKRTRVLVVDDSSVVREILKRILESDQALEVIGEAANGKEAVDLAFQLNPDIITLDVHMPVMNGLEATKQIMAYHPLPILIISTSTLQAETHLAFEIIRAGALDVMEKPTLENLPGLSASAEKLIEMVKLLSEVKVVTHLAGRKGECSEKERQAASGPGLFRVVAIASSTGGPQALQQVLSGFSVSFPAAVLIAQHIDQAFVAGLVEWLDKQCQIEVKLAEQGERVRPGVALVAPGGFHLQVGERGKVKLVDSPSLNHCKPSADILFSSVAAVYGQRAIGVVLTGMGNDGAKGLKSLKELGGKTIAQEGKSCMAAGMVKAAISNGAVDKVISLNYLADEIMKLV